MLRYFAERNSLSRCQASISWNVCKTGLDARWSCEAIFRSKMFFSWSFVVEAMVMNQNGAWPKAYEVIQDMV